MCWHWCVQFVYCLRSFKSCCWKLQQGSWRSQRSDHRSLREQYNEDPGNAATSPHPSVIHTSDSGKPDSSSLELTGLSDDLSKDILLNWELKGWATIMEKSSGGVRLCHKCASTLPVFDTRVLQYSSFFKSAPGLFSRDSCPLLYGVTPTTGAALRLSSQSSSARWPCLPPEVSCSISLKLRGHCLRNATCRASNIQVWTSQPVYHPFLVLCFESLLQTVIVNSVWSVSVRPLSRSAETSGIGPFRGVLPRPGLPHLCLLFCPSFIHWPPPVTWSSLPLAHLPTMISANLSVCFGPHYLIVVLHPEPLTESCNTWIPIARQWRELRAVQGKMEYFDYFSTLKELSE